MPSDCRVVDAEISSCTPAVPVRNKRLKEGAMLGVIVHAERTISADVCLGGKEPSDLPEWESFPSGKNETILDQRSRCDAIEIGERKKILLRPDCCDMLPPQSLECELKTGSHAEDAPEEWLQ